MTITTPRGTINIERIDCWIVYSITGRQQYRVHYRGNRFGAVYCTTKLVFDELKLIFERK